MERTETRCACGKADVGDALCLMDATGTHSRAACRPRGEQTVTLEQIYQRGLAAARLMRALRQGGAR